MLFEFEVADYRVVSCQPEARAKPVMVGLLAGTLDFEQVYRSNRHSFCARFAAGDETCMLKRPVGRNRRYWERFLTLFRPGESRRTFDSLVRLRELGFIGPEPWFAAEKRQSGVVVDSFVVYRFLDGFAPGKEDVAAVLDVLLRLHDLGYVRNDAKLVNFIKVDEGIGFIDFKLSRPWFASWSCAMELAQFLNATPGAEDLLPLQRKRLLVFKLACRVYQLRTTLRGLRRKARKQLRRS